MALTPAKIDEIKQAKMNALCARTLHDRRRAKYKPLIRLVDFLTLGIPGFYIVARLLAKGTGYADAVEIGWEFLAAALILLGFWKLVRGWGDQIERHRLYAARNYDMVVTADSLIARAATLSNENAEWFLKRVADLDAEDSDVLGTVSKAEKQEAVRDALQQFTPATAATVCPNCGANPWRFVPGSCQMCGGTPVPPAAAPVVAVNNVPPVAGAQAVNAAAAAGGVNAV
jgi:mobilome CxxCx(11)CxxC protein